MRILPLRCIGTFADLDCGARVGLTAACRDTRPGPADKTLNGRIEPCRSTGDPKGPGVRNGAGDPDLGIGRNLTYGDPGAELRAPLSSRGQRICGRDPRTPKARLSAACRAHSSAVELMSQSRQYRSIPADGRLAPGEPSGSAAVKCLAGWVAPTGNTRIRQDAIARNR